MNKKIVSILIMTLLIITISTMTTSSLADWDEGDGHKMHWPQLPDLDPTGMDCCMCCSYALADDFLCSESGPFNDLIVNCLLTIIFSMQIPLRTIIVSPALAAFTAA